MKTTDKNCFEPVDKQHYKKRYLVRKLEEEEAKKQIDEYKPTSVPPDSPPRWDGQSEMS